MPRDRQGRDPVVKGNGPFYFPDGKARFHAVEYEPPTEDVDAEHPVILTTGRVVCMFPSDNQTRCLGRDRRHARAAHRSYHRIQCPLLERRW
jgi:predicted molibdopterin-dependent oxidoreductase YjgC